MPGNLLSEIHTHAFTSEVLCGTNQVETKDDLIRALYAYMLSEPKLPQDSDEFRREIRSGKPTFIRFGKRIPSLVANSGSN
ncbi:unnamed protein product [Toxocara canis]|uniref:Rho-GAP domain-containing protein n=1 Tax=Toxocara canis TaxID=6265 RepID=A0A183U9T6_TOXCA|nr:unnamed protein product [Toxocara canis]